jgi:hypothetical protein
MRSARPHRNTWRPGALAVIGGLRRSLLVLALLGTGPLFQGCTAPPEAAVVAGDENWRAPEAWRQSEDVRILDSESVYELVNGQADAYFAYNFEQVTVRRYENAAGDVVEIEVWHVATPSDAYGLFTSNRAGEPAEIGNGGDVDRGRRVAFWQDRFYVRVRARQDTRDDVLHQFAAAIAASLPGGGEMPGIVARLPSDDMVTGSEMYFRLENSIQDAVWLGGENILGLDLSTQGALARYEIQGQTATLVVIEFGDRGAATTALRALQAAALDSLLAAGSAGRVLAAAFGDAPADAGSALVARGLEGG